MDVINDKTFQCSSLGERKKEERVRKRSKTEDGRREDGEKKEEVEKTEEPERETVCAHV